MAGRLQDKVAIITGGATGIGRAASVLFAREGARIVVADRNAPEAEKTVSLVREAGSDAFFVEVDVSKAAQVSAMVEQAVERFGRLDVLVNNAGVMIRTPPLVEVSELEWDLTMNTNLRGVFLCTKYAIPAMLDGGGAIVNVSSGAGTGPSPTAVPYGVSKGGGHPADDDDQPPVRSPRHTLQRHRSGADRHAAVAGQHGEHGGVRAEHGTDRAGARGDSPGHRQPDAVPGLCGVLLHQRVGVQHQRRRLSVRR